MDAQGNPSTDPSDYWDEPRGAVLPLGGPLGHKGTALSMLNEICGGGLSGQGMSAGDMRVDSNGVHITAYEIGQFVEPEFFYDEIDTLISHVKTSRPAAGVEEVLVASEPEYRAQRERELTGIPIDETTWSKLCDAARDLGSRPEHLGTGLEDCCISKKVGCADTFTADTLAPRRRRILDCFGMSCRGRTDCGRSSPSVESLRS